MKSAFKHSLTTLLTAGALAAVQAAPVVGDVLSFQDVVTPVSHIYLTTSATQGPTSYTYQHNILDNGFDPKLYNIVSAAIHLDLYDDGPNDGSERVKIVIDNLSYAGNQEVDYSVLSYVVNTKYILQEGLLTVNLVARNGDFLFRGSRLDVQAEVVPEPGTMALFGAGLLGLGLLARRRRA